MRLFQRSDRGKDAERMAQSAKWCEVRCKRKFTHRGRTKCFSKCVKKEMKKMRRVK